VAIVTAWLDNAGSIVIFVSVSSVVNIYNCMLNIEELAWAIPCLFFE
jgi:hypothetical protein